jgi:hypothetical protein
MTLDEARTNYARANQKLAGIRKNIRFYEGNADVLQRQRMAQQALEASREVDLAVEQLREVKLIEVPE